ncbi:alpha/beta fold hydrolase [Phycicoccus sp. Soil803]|uniref:alpha/beta fold hydrolase n=1 Tax=Phycicoccus sp. Soil803 TaxID=1736415 RepID=UPI00070C0D7B|nr:alpha/beta hydrolase [Phycicoccus sp. Soil803]KRF23675.1 alpha/beta hydrolase [Phycicoccus sp. Soil803]
MFEGFDEVHVDVADGVTLRCRHHRGAGPAVLLLHGHPRTHTTWWQVAPRLADRGMSVVCPDLRGYGQSVGPPPDADHENYCDRAMAGDLVSLMRTLGHDTWAVVGHDRGQGVAFRMAMDAPAHVARLVILDGIPIVEALERADARFAELWWHWFFFSSPHAERVITDDPLAWYAPDPVAMGRENHADLVRAIQDPTTVRAMLEDYRAGLHVDRRHAEEDRDTGRRVDCRTLVAWSIHDDMELLYGDPAAIWRDWCRLPVVSARIDSGHHMAEENPAQLAEVLTSFLLAD